MAVRIQLAITLLLVLIAGPANRCGAADWLVDAWRVEDGLPDNVVDTIAQTPDGYLWLGTQGGLASFDGIRFNLVDDTNFKIQRVRQLYVDREGRLWVLGEQGEIALIHEGQVKTFTTADGVPPHGAQSPTEDAQGRLWLSACADEGLVYFDGTRFINSTNTNVPAIGQFRHLAFDSDGTLYGERAGGLWTLHPSEPKLLTDQTGVKQRIAFLRPSRHGGFWLVSGNQCFLVRSGKWERIAQIPYELPATLEIAANYEDSYGRLWFATRQRPRPIAIATNGIVEDQTFTSRSNLNCRTLFEDREGNRWWSTSNDGLRRFRPRPVELVGDVENVPINLVYSVAADPVQGVWAAIGRGVVRITNTVTREPRLLPNRVPFARSLRVDSDQTVWVGGEGTDLFRIASNHFDHFHEDRAEQTSTLLFTTVFRDMQGHIVFGSSEGLFRLNNEGTRLQRDDDPTLSRLDFRAFAQDSRGQLYAGLRNGGLLHRTAEKWTAITNDLPSDDVAALYCDVNDVLWIGVTGHGLCRLENGKLFPFRQTHVRLPRNISGIIEDNSGFLWLASSEGIFEVARKDLNAVAEGQSDDAAVRQFGRSDGMVSSQCVAGQQPVVTRSTDDKLWFATTRGLCVVDPAVIPRASKQPLVALEAVFVDEETVWKRPLNSIREPATVLELPPENALLTFQFTALSLTTPQRTRFRFQLEGLNPDWVEANTERAVYYTRVPPGKYRFKVMACNHEGLWSEMGVGLGITVLPYWWQTSWFRSSAVAGVGLLLLAGYRWRMRGVRREQRMQRQFSRQLIESQERERQRISAELHDSLGQSLLVVKNYAVMALKESTPPEKMREKVRVISDAATASIEEVRSIARALRPYQLDRFGLTKTLEDAAELLAKTSNLKVEADVADIDRTFSADAEISIYRIVQEWLNNVTKHSQASVARLVVRREAGWANLIMEDNGIGFDYAAMKNRPRAEAGVGLDNLNERVRLLEGTLKIETSPGKGTRLCVDIPCKK